MAEICDTIVNKKYVARVSLVNFLFLSWTACLIAVFPLESGASTGTTALNSGRAVFERKCSPCHTIGGGESICPDLMGVTQRREKKWLISRISDPAKVIQSGDPVAEALVREYPDLRMPSPGLSEEEILSVLMYVEAQTARGRSPVTATVGTEGERREIGFIKNGQKTPSFQARG